MSYLLLDDGFGEHEKIEPLSNVAFRAHVLALLHCAKNLTDGYVSDITLKALGARVNAPPKKFRDELAAHGVWLVIPGGVMVHDYLEHNPTADDVRAKKRARADAGRRGGIASGSVRSKTEAIASPSVEPHPIPSPERKNFQAFAFTSYEGQDDSSNQENYNHALERLVELCGDTDAARERLTVALTSRGASEARLVAIHWACSQPGTRNRLKKALSMLAKEAA